MKYAIIGTGAVGGYLGMKLANAGHEVHFLTRSDYHYIKEKGLMLESIRGNIMLPRVNAYQSSEEMPKCDALFICTKTSTNKELPGILKPLISPNAIAVIFQNGIGMEEELSGNFPGLAIAGAPIYIAATKTGPGHILHQDIGIVSIAQFTPGTENLLRNIADDLSHADVKTTMVNNLGELRWKKLVWNIPFNGLSVAMNMNTDTIVANADTCIMAKEIMREVIRAANACGTPIEDGIADTMIELTRKMKPYATSMKVDYENRRPLELEYIYRRPLLLGESAGIAMPRTSALLEELIRLDRINQNRDLNVIS